MLISDEKNKPSDTENIKKLILAAWILSFKSHE